jgi:3-methylfumaryl-CoA hydratase
VVHGPLTAVLLLDLVRRNSQRPVVGFSFRGLAPLFDGHPLRLVGRAVGDSVELQAQGVDGRVAVAATATLA